jgi:atypical dual specificity phosphatase
VSEWFDSYGFAQVDERLLVGAVPADHSDVGQLADAGVTRVLNLVEDGEYRSGQRADVELGYEVAGIQEVRFSTVDYGGLSAPLLEQASSQVLEWLDDQQTVYVHCRAGWQRSATVAGAVLARRHRIDPEAALALINSRKPSADPLAHQRLDLQSWWVSRQPPPAAR